MLELLVNTAQFRRNALVYLEVDLSNCFPTMTFQNSILSARKTVAQTACLMLDGREIQSRSLTPKCGPQWIPASCEEISGNAIELWL
jgi:hypothetical protein